MIASSEEVTMAASRCRSSAGCARCRYRAECPVRHRVRLALPRMRRHFPPAARRKSTSSSQTRVEPITQRPLHAAPVGRRMHRAAEIPCGIRLRIPAPSSGCGLAGKAQICRRCIPFQVPTSAASSAAIAAARLDSDIHRPSAPAQSSARKNRPPAGLIRRQGAGGGTGADLK